MASRLGKPMRTVFVAVGVIALLVGIVWILQGSDVLMGSVMSGSMFWLGSGIVLAAVGVGLTGFGARTPKKGPA